MDDADSADQAITENLMAALHRRKPAPGPEDGHCQFCSAELPKDRLRFCDSFCREDFDREQAAKDRNGRW